MKKFFKFVGITIASLVVLFVILMIVAVNSDTSTNTSTEPKTEQKVDKPKADKPKAEKPKEVEKQYKIGDTLKVGDVEFTVHGTSQASAIGGQFGEKAKGKYLVLDVTVTNKGKEELLVDSSFFKLKADGKEYESDTMASVYANQNTSFFLEKVNPDLSLKGKVVFDVPVDLLQKELTLNVQTGYFGTEQGQIVLK